jgi:hypothetical protein
MLVIVVANLLKVAEPFTSPAPVCTGSTSMNLPCTSLYQLVSALSQPIAKLFTSPAPAKQKHAMVNNHLSARTSFVPTLHQPYNLHQTQSLH